MTVGVDDLEAMANAAPMWPPSLQVVRLPRFEATISFHEVDPAVMDLLLWGEDGNPFIVRGEN
jgi:hypothetical protein